MIQYQSYPFHKKEILFCLLHAFGFALVIAWLFYRSPWGLLGVLFFAPLFLKKKREVRIVQRRKELSVQFKECIRMASASMRTGSSPENAFREAEKEMNRLLGADALICLELREINRQVQLNRPMETLLSNLAARSGVEEILTFSQVFSHAKRSGGDFVKIMNHTTEKISDAIEVSREIQTLLSGKKMEQKIMSIIPLGILLFITFSAPEFIEALYQGVLGRSIMTICLLIYGLAWAMAEKIVEIEV
jgi:tight adherence protein B